MGLAESIAARMKSKRTDDEEEGSPEEEASEPEPEAAAEGDTGGEPESDSMDDYDSIEDSAVKDIMQSKDPDTVKAALRQFVRACMDREEKE